MHWSKGMKTSTIQVSEIEGQYFLTARVKPHGLAIENQLKKIGCSFKYELKVWIIPYSQKGLHLLFVALQPYGWVDYSAVKKFQRQNVKEKKGMRTQPKGEGVQPFYHLKTY